MSAEPDLRESQLQSETLEVDNDALGLYELSLNEKWGDGAPLIAPTTERVLAMLAATPHPPHHVICALPPQRGNATVELAAINAVMAGCTPAMLPLVIAALEAMTQRGFQGSAVTTTTAPVAPYFVVNGPSRDELGIDYGPGCMGGAAGRGSVSIGRAVALCLRNIGGMRAGDTTQSVLGQPARFGLCFGEWEERSSWSSLAVRRGFRAEQEVVSVTAGFGIIPLVDVSTEDDRELAWLIARSLAYPMTNLFAAPVPRRGTAVVVLNPVWAERFGATWPNIEELRTYLHEQAWQPIDLWPARTRALLEERGRVDSQGRVHATIGPQQIELMVAGGLGNLHSAILMTFGDCQMQSVAARRP